MLIKDLLEKLEAWAPSSLALDWDNVGLLLGDPSREINRVLLTLDVTHNAVDLALETGAKLILSHHPLIFRPLKRINDPLLLKLLENRIAVISMHTNLDVAPGGVNHALAAKLGLRVTGHLSSEQGGKWHHLCVTVPIGHTDQVADAVFNAGGGRIGTYNDCSTRHRITGTFAAQEGSRPFIPSAPNHALTTVSEEELEFMVSQDVLHKVMSAIRQAHPYEVPLIYSFPVSEPNPANGLGLVGELDAPQSLKNMLEYVSQKLGNPHPKLWSAGRDTSSPVSKIAVCGGAGASIIKSAEGRAELLITGDIGYHAMLESRIPIIDAGHFYTEYPVLDTLKTKLADWGVSAQVLPMENHEYKQNLSDY